MYICTVVFLRHGVKMFHINQVFCICCAKCCIVFAYSICMYLLYLQADSDVVLGGSDDDGMFVFDGLVLISGLQVLTAV